MAISVAVAVGEGTAEALLARMKERIANLKVADGTEPGAEMGPLVTGVHRDKVASYVELGVKEGAKLFVDSKTQETLPKGNGFFLAPCLFDGVTSEMRIYREEILALCSRSCAFLSSRTHLTWSTITSSATASVSSLATATRRALCQPGEGRHGRHQYSHPCAHGVP